MKHGRDVVSVKSSFKQSRFCVVLKCSHTCVSNFNNSSENLVVDSQKRDFVLASISVQIYIVFLLLLYMCWDSWLVLKEN